uniref:Uncharacterized protein n=1 Tax=Ananas comosus var. bracteatus TaxID=296719 RepID=A0A6V7PRE3_ANACO|nr:unnamed protein product [Ananas comosus var. bracteatus]
MGCFACAARAPGDDDYDDYFGLFHSISCFNNSCSSRFFLAAWPVVGFWFIVLGISTMFFNLDCFDFNLLVDIQDLLSTLGLILLTRKKNTWADISNRANLGMEVIHEHNAYKLHYS